LAGVFSPILRAAGSFQTPFSFSPFFRPPPRCQFRFFPSCFFLDDPYVLRRLEDTRLSFFYAGPPLLLLPPSLFPLFWFPVLQLFLPPLRPFRRLCFFKRTFAATPEPFDPADIPFRRSNYSSHLFFFPSIFVPSLYSAWSDSSDKQFPCDGTRLLLSRLPSPLTPALFLLPPNTFFFLPSCLFPSPFQVKNSSPSQGQKSCDLSQKRRKHRSYQFGPPLHLTKQGRSPSPFLLRLFFP